MKNMAFMQRIWRLHYIQQGFGGEFGESKYSRIQTITSQILTHKFYVDNAFIYSFIYLL